MSGKDKDKKSSSPALYENHGETFSEKVQNLANHIKEQENEDLNEALNMVIGVVPESRKRDLTIEATKAEIVELKKQRDDYKERAYELADQRPLLHDLKSFEHIHSERDDFMDEQRQDEAEERRKAEAAEFLGGL